MTTEIIKSKGDVHKLIALEGYGEGVSTLAKLTDTGNGYIFKFPTYTSTDQTNYICMDYAEADYIRTLLNKVMDK